LSLLTAALAEAMFASRVAGLTLELDEDEPELVSLGSAVVFVLLLGDVVAGVVVVVLLGDVVVGLPLLGVVLVGVLGDVVVGGVVACPGEGVEASAAVVRRSEAVEATRGLLRLEPVEVEPEAVGPVAVEPVEVAPVEPVPPGSSCLARLASADFRAAFDCSSVTSALCGLSVASS
jgi:hypothetical protein